MADGVRVVCLSELHGITLRTAETLGGDGHDHAHVHGEDEHEHEHAAFDEHLWLSPRNAVVSVTALCEELCTLDPANAERYRANAAAYADELSRLDAAFAAMRANAARHELLVADRFPFVYLVEEYGIHYCAAFSGCSTESQASFETVVRLATQADAWGLSHLLITEGSDGSLARSVIAASAQQDMTVLSLDSMQAVSAARAGEITYLSVMLKNLEILRAALS
jgi:zinc transport system substrate-binding protein